MVSYFKKQIPSASAVHCVWCWDGEHGKPTNYYYLSIVHVSMLTFAFQINLYNLMKRLMHFK